MRLWLLLRYPVLHMTMQQYSRSCSCQSGHDLKNQKQGHLKLKINVSVCYCFFVIGDLFSQMPSIPFFMPGLRKIVTNLCTWWVFESTATANIPKGRKMFSMYVVVLLDTQNHLTHKRTHILTFWFLSKYTDVCSTVYSVLSQDSGKYWIYSATHIGVYG